jgi:hypothetical protein
MVRDRSRFRSCLSDRLITFRIPQPVLRTGGDIDQAGNRFDLVGRAVKDFAEFLAAGPVDLIDIADQICQRGKRSAEVHGFHPGEIVQAAEPLKLLGRQRVGRRFPKIEQDVVCG